MFILLLGNQDSGKIYPCVRFIHGSSHLSPHSCMFTNVLPGSLLISPFFFFCDVCMPMHVCSCMRTCVADNFRCLRHLLSILLDVLLKLEVFSSVRLAGQEVSWIPPISVSMGLGLQAWATMSSFFTCTGESELWFFLHLHGKHLTKTHLLSPMYLVCLR